MTAGAYWSDLSKALAHCLKSGADLQTSRGSQADFVFQLSFTCGADGPDWLVRGQNEATIRAIIAKS